MVAPPRRPAPLPPGRASPPPPSPALSTSSAGGFSSYSVFDSPNELQQSTFHFPRHHDAFDDNHDQQDRSFERDPPLPPSPQSFRDTISDCSPSPATSLASVRTARFAVLKTATREVLGGQNGHGNAPGRSGVAAKAMAPTWTKFSRNSVDTVGSACDGPDDAGTTVFDFTPTGSRSGGSALLSAAPVETESAWIARTLTGDARLAAFPGHAEIHTAAVPMPSFVEKSIKGRARAVHPASSASEDSSEEESWRTDLDKVPAEPVQDPSIRPEVDAMMRMKSILGPKMKIISPAPWDGEDADTLSVASTSTSVYDSMPASRRSSDNVSRRGAKESPKENVKPKPTSRARSFSVLSSRRNATLDQADSKASEDALRGLGLGPMPDLGASPPTPPKSRVMKSNKSARADPPYSLDLASDARTRQSSYDSSATTTSGARTGKSSAPADFGGGMVTFPSTPGGANAFSTPPTLLPKSYISSRGRSTAPTRFDMVTSLPPMPASLTPRSAPANMATFSAVETALPKSTSISSLTVQIPPLKPSSSLQSIASGASPTPSPTSHFSAASPDEMPLSPASTSGATITTSPASGPGYKLISLAEARQRETDRVAVAAAQRKAMLPVEHLIGREEIAYGASEPRERESSSGSLAGRNSMASSRGPPSILASGSSSPHPHPSPNPLARSSTSTIGRELKSKKSGFLKRMLGSEKPSAVPALPDRFDAPSTESFRTLPDDYVHLPPVTVSLPQNTPSIAKTIEAAVSPNPGGRVAFLSTPVADPAQRLNKDKALLPSLEQLRPMSMAFLMGLPMGLLAEREAVLTPRLASPSADSNLHSPLAPSFRSSTTDRSTIFDSDSTSIASSAMPATPLTPAFSPLIPYFNQSAPVAKSSSMTGFEGAESFTALQDSFEREKAAWKDQRWDLESQIRMLNLELDEAKGVGRRRREGSAGGVSENGDLHGLCDKCGFAIPAPTRPKVVKPIEPGSILSRARPLQSTNASGGIFA